MKVKFTTNLGSQDAEPLGLDWQECRLGMELRVDDETGKHLIARNWAEVIHGLPKQPEIRGVPPVAGSVEKATADLENYRKRTKRETTTKSTAAVADSEEN